MQPLSFGSLLLTLLWSLLGGITVAGGEAASADEWLAALQSGDLKALVRLASPGMDLDQHDEAGKTALMLAAAQGHVSLLEQLLQFGARVDQRNRRGGTALMYAAQYGEVEAARRLLAAGSEVNLQAAKGWTALMVAVLKGRKPMTSLLLTHGADPNIQDMLGWTPLMRAVETNRLFIVQTLLAQPNTLVNAADGNGMTALHVAAALGHADMVKLLLAYGADARARDGADRTPSVLAQQGRHGEVARLLKQRSLSD